MTAETCRDCGARIEWAMNAKGWRVPLDPAPTTADAPSALVLVEELIPSLGGPSMTRVRALPMDAAIERLVKSGVSEAMARAMTMSTSAARMPHAKVCRSRKTRRR